MITPDELLMLNDEASVPDTEYVRLSPSASLALAVPTDVWFSATVNDALDVKTGEKPTSATSATFTVNVLLTLLVPSVTVTITEYDVFPDS